MTNLQDLLVQWTNYIVFMEPLYLMNSKIILTVAHLPVLWSDYWSPRAQQTTQTRHFRSRVGVSNVKMGVAKNFARARSLYLEPLLVKS